MLEDLALQYSEISEDDMRLIGYGLVILGGVIGGLTYRSTTEIKRAHYFALSGLIFLSVAIADRMGR
jgi:carbon starvation protein CstA